MLTFGIVTNSQHHIATHQHDRLSIILNSIENQNISEYEIIIIGDYKTDRKNTTCVEFDETVKPAWITRKKNIITGLAKFDTIVYMHDHVYLDDNWYAGWLECGFDWDLAMNVIINKDGSRFRDWCVLWFDGNVVGKHGIWPNDIKQCDIKNHMSPYLPEYDYTNTQYMYISGSYWLAKKHVMVNQPLDESLVWGQPEDIEWSFRVLSKSSYRYVMNTKSITRLIHQKDPVWRTV